MQTFLLIVQSIAAIGMIIMILIQTTKSESGSESLGFGVIGGKSTSSIHTRWGVEEHLGRITMWIAITFLVFSALASVVRLHNW